MNKITLKTRSVAFTAVVLSSLVLFGPEVWARCSLNIEDSISSGWNKDSVSYTVENNRITIEVDEMGWDDSDSIYIGSMRGCSTLTVNVSHISGEYPWDGKAFGLSFANDKREPHQWGNFASFTRPRGYVIDDGFIKAGLSKNTQLVYDIPDSSQISHIGAKIFLGSHNTLELQFSAQETSRELQLSERQPSRSAVRYAADADYRPRNTADSCSGCHEPRTRRSESLFDRVFSRSSHPACEAFAY
jgi:hypothetical protein